MTSILDLNQDILINIFNYLTVYELIDIEDTCSTFQITCGYVYKSKKFHSFKIDLRYLKSEYLVGIFERIGGTIKSFEFSGGYIMDEATKQTIIDGVSNSCIKLEKLTLNYIQFGNEQFRLLQKCFQNLTHLDLSRCSINEKHHDCLEGEIYRNIKSLKLAGNVQMTGAFFKNMRYIESLDVSYSFGVTFFYLQQFLKNCLNLKELNISACYNAIPDDVDIFREILSHQPKIEVLIMENVGVQNNAEILSEFKHLKYSSVSGPNFGL